MLATFQPDADDAEGLERLYPEAIEEDFDEHNDAFATAKFIYKPMGDDILALKRDSFSALGYGRSYTCGAGDAVGDPVRISADDTVTKALATTDANSKVIAFIVHKGPLRAASVAGATTCWLVNAIRKTGLAGLTAGGNVYLTDAGGYSATPGTIVKIVGRAINTTDALLFVSPPDANFKAPFTIVPEAANYPLITSDSGNTFTNAGSAGAIQFTLPAVKPGLNFRIARTANFNVVIARNAAETIYFGDSSGTSFTLTSVTGETFIWSDGTNWYVSYIVGNQTGLA